MANYYRFARQLNDLAHEFIRNYRAERDKLERAENDYNGFLTRKRTNNLSEFEQYLGDSADIVKRGSLLDARGKFEVFRSTRFNVLRTARGIREELQEQIAEDFAVRPEKIKRDVITILESGICTPRELCELAENEIRESNPTMARLIGKYISNLLDADLSARNLDRDTRTMLTATNKRIRENDGSVYLDRFDALIKTLRYMTGDENSHGAHYDENPALFDQWDNMTSELIEHGFD